MLRTARPRYYKDQRGEWRWMITAANYRRTHSSTEGFKTKAGARNNFQLLLDAMLAMASCVQTEDGPILE